MVCIKSLKLKEKRKPWLRACVIEGNVNIRSYKVRTEDERVYRRNRKILGDMDEVLVNGVVFIDLKKAFDTIDHVIMLNKLKSIGIDSTSLAWFHSYLSSRSQKPVIGQVTSKSRKVTIGFPQGSILGHCLPSTCINDVSNCLENCECYFISR